MQKCLFFVIFCLASFTSFGQQSSTGSDSLRIWKTEYTSALRLRDSLRPACDEWFSLYSDAKEGLDIMQHRLDSLKKPVDGRLTHSDSSQLRSMLRSIYLKKAKKDHLEAQLDHCLEKLDTCVGTINALEARIKPSEKGEKR